MTRLCLILLCSLWASVATAQDRFPALYDVVDVASDDILNLREMPGARYDVVGSLASDARNIEVIQITGDGTWADVRAGERNGWASTRFLARQPGQTRETLPNALRCFGTEPFWSLTIAADTMAFRQIDAPAQDFHRPLRAAPLNHPGAWGFDSIGTRARISGIIANGFCSDGMSDAIYGLDLQLLHVQGGALTHYSGCCSLNTN